MYENVFRMYDIHKNLKRVGKKSPLNANIEVFMVTLFTGYRKGADVL